MRTSLEHFDRSAAALIARFPDSFRTTFLLATYIGYPAVMAGSAALAALLSLYAHTSAITAASVGSILSIVLPTAIKLYTKRTRPATMYVENMRFKTYSFPSGHAFSSLVILGLYAYLATTLLPLGALVAIVLAVIIALVGISRIYLGAHFPSDVVGGWILGAPFLLLIIWLSRV